METIRSLLELMLPVLLGAVLLSLLFEFIAAALGVDRPEPEAEEPVRRRARGATRGRWKAPSEPRPGSDPGRSSPVGRAAGRGQVRDVPSSPTPAR